LIIRGKYNDIHESAKIADDVIISGYCYIGKGVMIGSGTKLGNGVHIDSGAQVGSNCNIQDNVLFNSDTIVKDRCFFAAYSKTADEVYVSIGKQVRKPCTFEEGSVIGINATIVSANIGKRAVVGAHSLVTKDIPAEEVWAGVPAKFLYTRSEYDRKKEKWERHILGR